MLITVKLFATLRKNRDNEKAMNFDEGSTVRNIIEYLNISEQEATIIFINGRSTTLDRTLSDNDTVSIFPPVGGG